MCSNVRFVHTVSFLWLLLLLLLWASVIAPAYYVAIIGFQMPDNVFFLYTIFCSGDAIAHNCGGVCNAVTHKKKGTFAS